MGFFDVFRKKETKQSRRAVIPTAPVLYRFQATAGFFSEEVGSQYVQGLTYSVRAGNEKLHNLVQQWAAEGKVRKL